MRNTYKIFIAVALFTMILATGCTAEQKIAYLSSEESAQVAAHTDQAANNIITAIATNDYNLFITDFDDKMRKALTEDQFANIVKIYGKHGQAESISLLNVEDREQFYGANYGATYPKATLTMLIVVAKSDPTLVSGLWFK